MNRYVLGLLVLVGAAIPVASQQAVRLPLSTIVQHPTMHYPTGQRQHTSCSPHTTHRVVYPQQHAHSVVYPQQVLVPVIVDSYALPVVGSGLPYYYSAGEAYVDRYYRAKPILEEPKEKKVAAAPAPSAPALTGTLDEKIVRIFSEVGRCVDCHQDGGKTSGGVALVQAAGASWKLVNLPADQRWQVVGVIAKKRMPPAARQDARQAVPSQYLVELAEWAAQVE